MSDEGSDRLRTAAERYLRGLGNESRLYEVIGAEIDALRAAAERAATNPDRVRDDARRIAEALAGMRDAAPVVGNAVLKGQIYTDGSAVPNPGQGGWAAVWVDGDRIVREATGGVDETTNNRMELQALIAAFEMAPAEARIEVVSDSQLAVRTVNEWGPRWRAAGWRKNRGAIANLDLVKKAIALREARSEWTVRWTRGHADDRWNGYADQRANEARAGGSANRR